MLDLTLRLLRVSTPTPQTNYRQSHSQVSPHLTHHSTSPLLSLACITIAESATEGVVLLNVQSHCCW